MDVTEKVRPAKTIYEAIVDSYRLQNTLKIPSLEAHSGI